jgi:hypothetical protein
MLTAIHDASARGRCVPPMPQWFKELPVDEQLRRWQEAWDRGDWFPAFDAEAGDAEGGGCDAAPPYGATGGDTGGAWLI